MTFHSNWLSCERKLKVVFHEVSSVFRAQAHLVITLGQIKLGEPPGSTRLMTLVQECINVLERFERGLRDGVETPVVVANAPRAVLLPCEDHQCSVSRSREPTTIKQVT
jgi:hypothetical protein